MRMRNAALILTTLLLLGACGKNDADPAAGSAETLTVLAGSELKDIEPLLPKIEAATGLRLKLKYAGTLDAVEQMQAGANFDLAWLASNKYALLTPGVKERIKASERTMLSAIVMGVKTSKAKTLGWEDPARPPTWLEIAKAAGERKLRFAMTNPASSNTGFSALLGLAAAASGQGEAMELKDIDFKTLASFAKAQSVTAGSSGWLADTYEREAETLDGLVNYASVLQALNASGRLREPLTLIYPKDGVITADYPLMLLNEKQRGGYDRLVSYLKGEDFQRAMTRATYRQPVNPSVVSSTPAPTYFELAFPARVEVIDGLLDAYLNTVRRPADSTFVVDVSGSMQGERIEQLRKTLIGLSGSDASLSGRFARLRDRETISVVRFSDHVEDRQVWRLGADRAANAKPLQAFADYAGALKTTGGTAIYSATRDAYMAALDRQQEEPDRVYTLLLMTDGKNNGGISAIEFTQWFAGLPADQRKIRIFAVLFGEARSDELEALTEPSGGRVFDGNKAGLQAAFKEIRGYQ